MTIQLFVALATASTSDDIFNALNEYAPNHQMVPIGAKAKDAWGPERAGWNNRFAVEVMANADGALFEKIMNGFDAHIALAQYQKSFTKNPMTPVDALNELSESAWTVGKDSGKPRADKLFLYVSTQTESPGTNVTVIDTGVGVRWMDFPSTIMSIGGNNKITNPLMAGSYGFGGAALNRFATCTLVYSVSVADPSKIGFTVVFRAPPEKDWKADSYVYATDGDGNVFNVDISALPGKMVVRPSEVEIPEETKDITSDVLFRDYLERHIILPVHGTTIRAFDMEGFRDKVEVYNAVREMGFGMSFPVRYLHGASKKRHASSYNILGLRNTLNDPRRALEANEEVIAEKKAAGRSSNINPLLYKTSYEILSGQAKLTIWVLNRKNTEYQAKDVPVANILRDQTKRNPIFVTLNGQTHRNLPIWMLLKNSGLEYLDGHVIIEINCDLMGPDERREYFTSNRENITKKMDERIKESLLRFFRAYGAEGQPLRAINDYMRQEFMSKAETFDVKNQTERFVEVMKMSVAGNVFSKFGGVVGKGDRKGTGEGVTRNPRQITPRVLNPIPTVLEIKTKTVEIEAEDEHIRINTDAYNEWKDKLSIQLPAWLKQTGMVELKEGRASFVVKVDPSAQIGDVGTVKVRMDRSSIKQDDLIASMDVSVVKRQTRQKPKARDEQHGIPDIKPILMAQDNPNFMVSLMPGKLVSVEKEVAFKYRVNPTSIDVFINADFAPFVTLIEHVSKTYDAEIAKQAKEFYQMGAMFLSLADIENQEENKDATVLEDEQQHRINAIAMRSVVMVLISHYDSMLGRKPKATGKRAKVA